MNEFIKNRNCLNQKGDQLVFISLTAVILTDAIPIHLLQVVHLPPTCSLERMGRNETSITQYRKHAYIFLLNYTDVLLFYVLSVHKIMWFLTIDSYYIMSNFKYKLHLQWLLSVSRGRPAKISFNSNRFSRKSHLGV